MFKYILFLILLRIKIIYTLKQCDDCVVYTSCPNAMELARRQVHGDIFQTAFCGRDISQSRSPPMVCCSDFAAAAGNTGTKSIGVQNGVPESDQVERTTPTAARAGFGCQYAHYGYCPDKVTIARGPNNEGCGCQYTQFGCCPDRHTEATGPNMEGCGCNTYQFGCCADGVTRATGPDQQGCRCETSKYGCCGDGVTAAQGPDMLGCDCSNSKYGCCPDGVTEAQGKKFLNCTDKLQNRQAACALAFDKGSCRNYTVYWYYDRIFGGCSRFWYSGCEGNDNRFSSQEECEDICVHPHPKDACNLPMVKGACTGYNVHWYYDSEREQCSQFVYGGCLGNNNKFDSRELCQKQCEPEKTEDKSPGLV